MTFTVPTVPDLKAAFTAFTGVSDVAVQFALDEASCVVDDCWGTQKDFTLAYLLYTAHALTLNGHGGGVEAKLAAQGLTGFDTIRSGELSVTRKSGVNSPDSEGSLDSTLYGRRFIEIRDRLFAGPRFVSACHDAF